MFQKVFDGQNADGNSLVVDHGGGEVEIIVANNLGGGTVTAYAEFGAGNGYVPLDNGEWTEPLVKILRTVRPCKIRLTLSGATAPDVDAWI